MWQLDYKESWAPKNWCLWTVLLEKTLESPLDCKEIQPVHSKRNQSCPSLEGQMLKFKLHNILAMWLEVLTHWKRPWRWERLKAGGEGDDRGWDGWMASLTQWSWVWVNSGSLWWTGGPGVLSTYGHKELDMTGNWTELTEGTNSYIQVIFQGFKIFFGLEVSS